MSLGFRCQGTAPSSGGCACLHWGLGSSGPTALWNGLVPILVARRPCGHIVRGPVGDWVWGCLAVGGGLGAESAYLKYRLYLTNDPREIRIY